MSSPFSIFRKHQRAMMAVLGIMCMVAFTFTGFVGGLGSFTGGGRQDPVAVETSFGDYRESDLQDMRNQRNLVKAFLREAMILAFQPQMRPYVERQLSVMLDNQIIGPSTDTALLESRILAREAKREGLIISDDAVTDFLRQQTGDQVKGDQLQAILVGLSRRGRVVSRAMLYEGLRTELLAIQMRQMFAGSLQTTPAERWDYYQRLKRRVRVELAPVAASDFVSKVAAPPDDVARNFFNEFKDREPEPGSPDPGFKIPHRAAFDYFEVHYQDFYHPEAITEADIKQEYEKNKDTRYLYNEVRTPSEEDEEPALAEPGKSEEPKKPAQPETSEKPGATERHTPGGTTKDAKNPAATQADTHPTSPDSAGKKSASQGPDGSKAPAAGEGKPENKSEKKAADQKEEQKDDSGTDNEQEKESEASAADCGASAGDEDSPADAESKDAESKEDEPKDAESKPAESKPAAADPTLQDKKPASPKPPANGSAAQPADAESAPAAPPAPGEEAKPGTVPPAKAPAKTEPPAPKKSTAPPLSDRFVLPSDITKGPNPKYEPLWQAESKIRRELAQAKAVQAMEKTVLEIKGKLRPYIDARVTWEGRKQQDPNLPPPTPPKFDSIAKGMRGVTTGRIPLSPDFQISQLPGIGTSMVGGQPFVAFAATGLKVFHAVESVDGEENRYLFWKTDDQEARVPKFDEVRDEVVQAWKMREARKPMLQRTEELAKKARQSNKALKDTLADQGVTVTETTAFSWMTGGSAGQFNQQSEPQLSEVPGTVDIGNEFMQKVFDLQVGDVGVAENHPETIAYVVRMTTSEPPQPVLRDMFLADRFESYDSVARETNRSLFQQWLREQMTAFRVHWVRPPYDDTRYE